VEFDGILKNLYDISIPIQKAAGQTSRIKIMERNCWIDKDLWAEPRSVEGENEKGLATRVQTPGQHLFS
jgi:hypothetical protein